MKILLTGATGYIGKRILPILVDMGHDVLCCVRDLDRFEVPSSYSTQVKVLEMDLLDPESLQHIPSGIDVAYYLVHSMSAGSDYASLERQSAIHFRQAMNRVKVRQVIYLSGIVNQAKLSKHLSSRREVEHQLSSGDYCLTTLRAGIIIGSGSASFEIIRDLVEKLPIMVTPKWLNTRCQPIGIRDVIQYLTRCLLNPICFDKSFDIGGRDVLTYRDMLLGYAQVRGLSRYIITVPVMTPRLSSYWLYFVTSTSYKLAVSLVNSMKVEVVCTPSEVVDQIGVSCASYETSLKRAMRIIQSYDIPSSWKDSYSSSNTSFNISDFIQVPSYGCFVDSRTRAIRSRQDTLERIWAIGGTTGWYYANGLWRLRGLIDKCVGGVGLRRGRTNPRKVHAGDAIDFWRVLYANKEQGRLLLFAEMKLPGEAWLEFKIERGRLVQTATFRPLGLAGRLYWMLVYPFHGFIFKGMLRELTK